MIYQCKGRFSQLIELTTDNEFDLFQLMDRNRFDYARLVSNQKVPINYTEFKKTLNTWFLYGRAYQFLVYPIQSNQEQAIGTIFFYGLNKEQQSVKISVFFDAKERGKIRTAESLGLAVSFARTVMTVRCLQFSIYSNNQHMLRLAQKVASHFEGFGHSHQGPKKEVHHYSISEETMDSILQKLTRFYR